MYMLAVFLPLSLLVGSGKRGTSNHKRTPEFSNITFTSIIHATYCRVETLYQ